VSAQLQGRVALVTGAGRGIGREIALGLARDGARVALLARTTKEIDGVAHEINVLGGTALVLTADIGGATAAKQAVRTVSEELGPIEILVNNAAVVWPLGASATIDPAQWELAAQINLLAPVRLTIAMLPGMIERAWGRIVNVSSGVAANPDGMIGGNAYTATKAALEAHTLNLAVELRESGEQDPAVIGRDLHERFIAMHKSGTLLTPEQSASALLERLRTGGTGQIWNVSD